MPSIWEQQSFYQPTDYLIIGAGFTGLYTALELSKLNPKASIRVLERGINPEGASVRNAGFACFGSPSEILDDAAEVGMDAALSRVLLRYEGLQYIRELVGEEGCGWQLNGGYELFSNNAEELHNQCLEALPSLNEQLYPRLGFNPYEIAHEDFGLRLSHTLIRIRGEASLNTGSLILNLLALVKQEKVDIRFGTEVTNIEHSGGDLKHLSTNTGKVYKAERVILATKGFTRNIYDLPVWPNRGQVLLTESIPALKLKGNFHLDRGYYYFRDYQGGILLGGGRHLAREQEQTQVSETSEEIQNALETLLSTTILPGQSYRIKARWAGIMGFGAQNDKEPIIEEIRPGVYAGVRLGGMGVAMAPIIARKLVKLM